MRKISFATLLLFVFTQFIAAQYNDLEEYTTFERPSISPIEMDVQQKDNTFTFNAINKSYYNYELKIKFKEFLNLSPRIYEKQILLNPGTNVLFTLTIVDVNREVKYNYSIEYVIGSHNYKADLTFPYLIPLGNNKVVKLFSLSENGKLRYQVNHFKMNRSDTVFCIRKGLVTALPDNKIEIDRIVSSSLEILHKDGTIAVYRGLDAELLNLKIGQTVFAGQPIGLIGFTEVLILNVFNFAGAGKIQNLKMFFAVSDDQIISSELLMEKKFSMPVSIIKNEMTKKEAKRYDTKDLF